MSKLEWQWEPYETGEGANPSRGAWVAMSEDGMWSLTVYRHGDEYTWTVEQHGWTDALADACASAEAALAEAKL